MVSTQPKLEKKKVWCDEHASISSGKDVGGTRLARKALTPPIPGVEMPVDSNPRLIFVKHTRDARSMRQSRVIWEPDEHEPVKEHSNI